MSRKIIIVGAFHEIIELAENNNYKIIGLFDKIKKSEYYGYKIIGSDDQAKMQFKKFKDIPVIITPDKPELRKMLVQYYSEIGFSIETLISDKSHVSPSSYIGEGSIVQSFVNVSNESKIGKYVKLNTMCNIMHDVTIGEYTTIAPNAVLLGNVKIGSSCYIGANSTILPNIRITDNTVVGAGATVTKNIETPGIFVGCPARRMKQ